MDSFLHFPHRTIFTFPQLGHGNLVEFFTVEMSVLHELQINFSIEVFKYVGFLYVLMKQAIVIRENLGLSIGKTCAQAAHASLGSALEAKKEWFEKWKSQGQKKIVLRADLKTIKELKKKASSAGIPNKIIRDAGLTEILPGTITGVGIGPAPEKQVDKLVGSLPLL